MEQTIEDYHADANSGAAAHATSPDESSTQVTLYYFCRACTATTIAVTAFQWDLAYWANVYCCRCCEPLHNVRDLLTVGHYA